MLKSLTIILATCLAFSAVARENVTIVYGWSPSDAAANFHRSLAAEANKIQDKYTFIFDTKPGAGASIAAQYVGNTPDTILATSTAFWIRPNFFPNESHDVAKYRELMPQCEPPLQISSKKYQSWKDVPADKPLTIAVSGLGITTHLVATEIAKKYPNLTVIPFKSTTESVMSVLSDVTDFSVNFNGDSEQYVNAGKLHVLGVTGPVADGKYPALINDGFPKILSSMMSPAHLVVPKTISEEKFKEWREILVKAGRSDEVRASFTVDHCSPLNQMPDNKIDNWFDKQNALWKGITSGVTLK
jgi:tripartite-type tricarboxylate transporter receptor subunit TctC